MTFIYIRARLCILSILLILFAFGCSEPNGSAPAPGDSVHPAGWNNPLETQSRNFHGTYSLQNTAESCRGCHGTDLNGTVKRTGCNDCHFGPEGGRIPAGADWNHDAAPHQGLVAFEAVCNRCHTLYRELNAGPEACHDCHGQGTNHPLGQTWLDPKNSRFHGLSDMACTDCHDTTTDCSRCHFGAGGDRTPPASGWTHGINEAHKALEAYSGTCNACHDLNRTYGNPPASCHDCHAINHPLGQAWLDSKNSDFHGRSDLTCTDCHNTATDCSDCHFGADGGKTPPASGWTHGNNDAHKAQGAYSETCNTCHDLNRTYGNPPVGCHDCHAINHPLGQAWLDTGSAEFHGQSDLNCSGCHNTATECNQCHFGADGRKAPVGSSWSHGLNNHDNYEAYTGICNTCHDLNRSYGNGPANCHDCHGDGD